MKSYLKDLKKASEVSRTVQKIGGASDSKVAGLEERLVNANKSAKDSPWYLVIGPSGCGKTSLLRNSTIDFSYIDSLQETPVKEGIEETKDCDLFFTREAVVLDTTGRYVTLGNEAQVKSEWLGLLSLLKKHREQRPIEGLIVAVDVARLLQNDEDAIKQEAKIIRDRIIEIVEQLEIKFPVYLVFTKCDVIYGFAQFFDDLTSAERTQVWGCTLKNNQQENPEAAFQEECKQLFQSLNAHRLSKTAKASAQDRSAVYTFPLEFDAAYQKIAHFVSALFPSVSKEQPTLRGFYFTSATQEGNPIDLVLQRVAESLDSQPPELSEQPQEDTSEVKSYFIKDLFNQVIFPDRGLGRVTTTAERRSMRTRWLICAAAMAVFAILAILLIISYSQNKRLMADMQNAAVSANKSSDDTRFEGLRKSIVKSERSGFFSFPWGKQRKNVTGAARKFYLLKRYGSGSGWEVKLSRDVKIDVKVFRAEADKRNPIEKASVKAVVSGKEYNVQTDKDGSATLKAKVEDGKVEVVFSTDHQETEYELPQRKQTYEIQPGERVSSKGVQFIFSKLGRVITVHCTDPDGKNLPGVPVSIIEKAEESQKYGPETSNEQGIAQFRLALKEGSVLLIYYGDSPQNYPEEQADTITIQSGQDKYPIEKQLRRKLDISVMALEESNPKPGVSVSVGGKKLGLTDTSGKWAGPSDTIPTEQNVTAEPAPNKVRVDETSSGYSIVLEYALDIPDPKTETVITKPDEEVSPPPPVAKSLQAVTETKQPIQNVEVWVYLGERETNPFDSVDEMAFESGGKNFKLVRFKSTTANGGKLTLPKEAKERQFLLYHPDYWPQNTGWQQIEQPVQMVSIKRERSVEYFDKAQRDGAEYYYERAQEYYNEGKLDEAIKNYQHALRLAPQLKYYLTLGWAYYESDQTDAARRQVNTGLAFRLLDSGANEQLLKQQLKELLDILQQ